MSGRAMAAPHAADELAPARQPTATHRAVQTSGRIGPNAVTRLAEALSALQGEETCRAVFAAAGAEAHLAAAPTSMVDEMTVARLHQSLHARLAPHQARAVSRRAGELTARYLLDNRIPRLAQTLLRRLPAWLALRILCAAITRHAWTFTGSGAFTASFRPDVTLTITHGPVARLIRSREPACAYYAATFESVLSGALGRRMTVRETACEAMGAPACVFEVTW
jgi:divinyl protochlorophyllide a 8-vinyl-reductase